MNQHIKNGNALIHSIPGATSNQLPHYLEVSLDKYTDTGVIHFGMVCLCWDQEKGISK